MNSLKTSDFCSSTFCRRRKEDDIKSVLNVYHFYIKLEEFNPQQDVKEEFVHDFGKGERKYRYSCYVFFIDKLELKFVVAKEQFNEEELKELEEFCPCPPCTIYKGPKFNYYLTLFVAFFCGGICGSPLCSHCNGCILCGKEYASQYNVNKARELKYKNL